MAFTPLGYLNIGVIEITFLMIPVAIGAMKMGPAAGGLLGGVFGLTSFAQCFLKPTLFSAALLGISPVYTFVMCMVPRILAGILVALIFRVLTKNEEPILVGIGVASWSAAALNTVLFIGFFLLLFGSTDFVREMQGGTSMLVFIGGFIGLNGIVEMVVSTLAGTLIGKALDSAHLL